MAACKCNSGLSNTGTDCAPLMAVANKVILVPYYDSEGVVNTVDPAVTLNAAYFNAKINHVDPSKRWYPLPPMKNITDERGANIVESFNDGSSVFISEGNRAFSGLIIGGTPQLKKAIDAARCLEVGVFVIDKEGNLIGSKLVGGLIAPIKLDQSSVSALFVKTTDTTVQKIIVSFNFDSGERDVDLYMILADDIDFDLRTLKGLLDIEATFSDITTTGFTATLKTLYNTFDKGLVAADFTLFNNTDSSAIIITSVAEDPDGVYAFVIPAQTAGDILALTATKAGRDYTVIVTTPILIP